MPTYLVSISLQPVGTARREQDQVVAVLAADAPSALRKAERTLRSSGRSAASMQCLGTIQLPDDVDRRVFKRRAADCH